MHDPKCFIYSKVQQFANANNFAFVKDAVHYVKNDNIRQCDLWLCLDDEHFAIGISVRAANHEKNNETTPFDQSESSISGTHTEK